MTNGLIRAVATLIDTSCNSQSHSLHVVLSHTSEASRIRLWNVLVAYTQIVKQVCDSFFSFKLHYGTCLCECAYIYVYVYIHTH